MNLMQSTLLCGVAALFLTACDSVTVVERHPDRRYGYHGHDRGDYYDRGYHRRPSTTVVVDRRPDYRRPQPAPSRRAYVSSRSAYRSPSATVVVTDRNRKYRHGDRDRDRDRD